MKNAYHFSSVVTKLLTYPYLRAVNVIVLGKNLQETFLTYTLSLCDRIVGPWSTYSRWASFIGGSSPLLPKRKTTLLFWRWFLYHHWFLPFRKWREYCRILAELRTFGIEELINWQLEQLTDFPIPFFRCKRHHTSTRIECKFWKIHLLINLI